MENRRGGDIMSQTTHPLKKALLTLYILGWCVLLTVAAWALTVYLVGTLGDPRPAQAASSPASEVFDSVLELTEKKVERYLGEWEFSEPELPGHFHHVGRWYEPDHTNFCIDCHGAIPHSRSPKVRAFLNMHNLFIACQTCHVRDAEETRVTHFGWLDLTTGQPCPAPTMHPGVWGEYGAKIIPMQGPSDDGKPIRLAEEETLAQQIQENGAPLDDSQKVKANKFIHRRCAETPVGCIDCHNTQETYLPYRDLGYSRERSDFLISAEVADLVARYEVFHLPNLLQTDSEPNQTERELTRP
jgi:hypothetical protein